MYKSEGWNFERSEAALFGEMIAGFPVTTELAGPDGCHAHVWLPAKADDALLAKVESEARAKRDIVSMSWEPFTPEVRAWLRSRTPPKGYVWAKMPAILADAGMINLFWGKGRKMMLDGFSRSALKAVYVALNEANQKKLSAMVEAGPNGLAKAVAICFSLVK